MEFTEVIKNRYSCKKYSDKEVTKEKIDQILLAAKAAPTAKNLQEQKLYVIQSEEGLKKVDECTPCRYHAPVVIMVAFDKNNVYTYPGDQRDSGVEDATIVATHMILQAYNVGLDSCWVNNVDLKKAKEVFNLPENEEILMLMDLGYGDNFKPLPNHTSRKDVSEYTKYL